MNTRHMLFGAGTAALLSLAAAAGASTVNVGTTVISTLSQNETLTNGDKFTLDTTVFQNAAGLYTYQYNLTNLNDPSGITTLAPTVSGASDFGTSGLTFFFGGSAVGGDVAVDGTIGNDLANASPFDAIGDARPRSVSTALAYGNNARVVFVTDGSANAIQPGSSNFSQLGDYYYIQSHSAPGSADINVTDNGSADFPGPAPSPAPEPGSIATFALGGVGLMGLMLRVRKVRHTTA